MNDIDLIRVVDVDYIKAQKLLKLKIFFYVTISLFLSPFE